jgi:Ran GTPase-activating protein (RanGAP) involved in mRNA processing and transport
LWQKGIAAAGAIAMAAGLKNNSALRSLSYVLILKIFESLISSALSVISDGNVLLCSLSYNQIGDVGAVGLGEALKTNTVLRELRCAACMLARRYLACVDMLLVASTRRCVGWTATRSVLLGLWALER